MMLSREQMEQASMIVYQQTLERKLATLTTAHQQAVEALAGVRGKLERLQQFVDSGQLMKNYKAVEAALKECQRYFTNRTGNHEVQMMELIGAALRGTGGQ